MDEEGHDMTDTNDRGPRPIDDAEAGALLDLYSMLESRARVKGEAAAGFTDMNEDERREYMREAKRRSRQRQKTSADDGLLQPTADNVRSALADGAIRILREGGPGSDVLLDTLKGVFDARPGVPMTTLGKIRTGRMKPRLWREFREPLFMRKARAKRRKAESAPGNS
jgi:hypothetical protein